MKILLSAYACQPAMGSDPGIGWQWAVHLARAGHRVCALTRRANRASIEAYLADHPLPEVADGRLTFAYYDLPHALAFWKKGYRGIHLYYFLWQIGAFFHARALHRAMGFDAVQHATFVSARQPSFMGLLGIPFVFGPVGGGETSPWALRQGFPAKGWLWEIARDLANAGARVDPLMHLTFASATKIWVGTEDTRRWIPGRYHGKTDCMPLAALTDEEAAAHASGDPLPPHTEPTPLRLLSVGRLWYWKGMQFTLAALARLRDQGIAWEWTLVGEGPQEAWLRQQARAYGLEEAIDWIPRLPREALLARYRAYDAFVFPSLHDSGGFVVLEAMAAGLPVLCFDLGGPGVMVDASCGRCLDVQGLSTSQAVEALARALAELAASPPLRATLASGARRRAQAFTWPQLIARAYPAQNAVQRRSAPV